jgi:hypothetical protein
MPEYPFVLKAPPQNAICPTPNCGTIIPVIGEYTFPSAYAVICPTCGTQVELVLNIIGTSVQSFSTNLPEIAAVLNMEKALADQVNAILADQVDDDELEESGEDMLAAMKQTLALLEQANANLERTLECAVRVADAMENFNLTPVPVDVPADAPATETTRKVKKSEKLDKDI